MATPRVDTELQSFMQKLRKQFQSFIAWPTLEQYYTHKYKGILELRIDSYYREKEQFYDNLTRKYQGDFTVQDYVKSNWARMFIFNFTQFFGFSKISVSKDLGNACRGFLRGSSSVFLLNALSVQLPLLYAAQTTNYDNKLSFIEYMFRSTMVGLLFFPLQVQAMWKYRQMVGYRPISYERIQMMNKQVEISSDTKQSIMNQLKYRTCLPFLGSQIAFSAAVYSYNSQGLISNTLYYPLLALSYYGIYLGGQLVSVQSQQMKWGIPRGFFAFMLLNTLLPIKIQQLWGKQYFKNEYYNYLDRDVEDLKQLSLEYYQQILEN